MDHSRELQRILSFIERRGMSRRELMRQGAAMGLGTTALVAALNGVTGPRRALARSASAALQVDWSAGVRGGTLRVATIGEPLTLDEHQTTADITALIGYNMYEGLFT